jgi:DNA-binding NtrC family response regulator
MGEAMPASSPEVLLVEDEALISLMIEDALTEAGFRVHTFSRGRDALAYLAAGGRADVLFTDIDIAGDIDGIELARRIRALRAGIAVVYASGRREAENAVAGSAFLPKPFILAQACAAVERMVARRHAA